MGAGFAELIAQALPRLVEELVASRPGGVHHAALALLERPLLAHVLDLTGGKGVDVVVDNIGVDTFESSLRSLRKDGRYVLCGVTSGHKAEVHLGLVFTRGLSIMGVGWWRNAEFATVWKLAERRIFKGVVFKTYPLALARDAHAFMEGREFYGKIVLKP